MAKDILFNMEAREQLKKGVDELANAVKERKPVLLEQSKEGRPD